MSTKAEAAAPVKRPRRRPIPSPCVGICTGFGAAGWCGGCGRSGDEIDLWPTASAEVKRAIWHALPERLGGGALRLGPEPEAIMAFVRKSLDDRAGTWVLGTPAIAGIFPLLENNIEIVADDETVAAHAGDAVMELRRHDSMRVFGIFPHGPAGAMQSAMITLPRARLTLANHETVVRTTCDDGPDAIDLALCAETAAITAHPAGEPDRRRFAAMEGKSAADGLALLAAGPRITTTHFTLATGLATLRTAIVSVDGQQIGGANGSRPMPRIDIAAAASEPAPALPSGISIPQVFAPCAQFIPTNPAWLSASLNIA